MAFSSWANICFITLIDSNRVFAVMVDFNESCGDTSHVHVRKMLIKIFQLISRTAIFKKIKACDFAHSQTRYRNMPITWDFIVGICLSNFLSISVVSSDSNKVMFPYRAFKKFFSSELWITGSVTVKLHRIWSFPFLEVPTILVKYSS